MIYGLKEKVIPMRKKERTRRNKMHKQILKQLNDEDEKTKFKEEVEEVMRLGPYIEGGVTVRPIKLRLKTQTATEEILARAYKLRNIAEYKDVFIMNSMNEEERQQFKELEEETKQRNEKTTEEKTKFFWSKEQDKEMIHKQQILERNEK